MPPSVHESLSLANAPLPEGMDEAQTQQASGGWWPGPASGPCAQAWRDEHRAALALLWVNQGAKEPRLLASNIQHLTQMVFDLVHRRPQACNSQAKIDPEDERVVLRTLGVFLSQKGPKDDRLNIDPLFYLVEDLFQRWTARGCEGAVISPPASGVVRWKNRPSSGEATYHHWIGDLIRRGFISGAPYGRQMDTLKPWRALRPGLETFLDGWISGQPKCDSKSEEEENTTAKRRLTPTGAGCLALRSMATIIPRRIPPATADRLEQLERWMGPGKIEFSAELVATQQAAWDRYILERHLRSVHTSKKDEASKFHRAQSSRARRM